MLVIFYLTQAVLHDIFDPTLLDIIINKLHIHLYTVDKFFCGRRIFVGSLTHKINYTQKFAYDE